MLGSVRLTRLFHFHKGQINYTSASTGGHQRWSGMSRQF